MPRDTPTGALVNEIALLSEEIDRLERHLREPESRQARVQELIAQHAELLVKFREAQNVKSPPREKPKKKEGA